MPRGSIARLAVITAVAFAPVGAVFAAHGDDCVGINTHLAPDDVYDAVAAAGIPWVRIDVNWNQIEGSKGSFNFSSVDRVVNTAAARGLKIFATFAYTPPWASSGNIDGKDTGNDVPKPGLYEVSLRETVKHFRGKVAHWGLWNEPNLGGFFEGTAQQYVDVIVKPGAAAVNAECPECFVLGPELATAGDKVNEYYDTILPQAGALFDIITHHTYHSFPEIESGAGLTSDSFYNAIEKGRFPPLTRYGLYQKLTQYGLDGKDVWITETGYRCKPPADTGEMNTQKKYYELVLKAQSDRDWYTNTFFYEILDCGWDIPNCDIDGYGILRRTSAPDGTWQDNFQIKPAYTAVKDWLAAHPGWKTCSGGGTDGGIADAGKPDGGAPDAGRSDGGTPAIPEMHAVRTSQPPAIDGQLGGWILSGEVHLTSRDYMEINYPTTGDADLSARLNAMWDGQKLYLAAIITDDKHVNSHAPAEMWMGDSWQIAFDADNDRTSGAYDTDGDYEVGFALLGGGPSTNRWAAPAGAPSWNPSFAAGQDISGNLVLEVSIPWSQLPPFTPAVGKSIGFTFLVNDDDGAGRKGFVEWTPGIGFGKDPSKFGRLVLDGFPDGGVATDSGTQADSGASDGSVPKDGGGGQGDGGTTIDAAATDRGGVQDDSGGEPEDDGGAGSGDASRDGASAPADSEGGCSCSAVEI